MADKSLTKKELKAIAEELNKVAELDDEDYIDPKQDPKKLQKELEEVVGGDEPQLDIYPEDEFSEEGWKILEKLGSKVAAERNLNVEEEPEEETEEESEEKAEEETEEIDYDALSDEIEGIKKIADLKKIVEENEDTFADLNLKEFKKASELKQAMLDEINKIAPRAEDEESDEEAEEVEEEEKDFADNYTTEDVEKLKKKGILELVEKYDLDVDTEKSVKKMKEEIIKKYLEEGKDEPEPRPEPKKKKEVKAKEKTEPKPKKSGPKNNKPLRVDTVLQAIDELCKKGATYDEIYDRADDIYVENGGNAGSIAQNVTKNTIKSLLFFNVIEEKGDKLIFSK